MQFQQGRITFAFNEYRKRNPGHIISREEFERWVGSKESVWEQDVFVFDKYKYVNVNNYTKQEQPSVSAVNAKPTEIFYGSKKYSKITSIPFPEIQSELNHSWWQLKNKGYPGNTNGYAGINAELVFTVSINHGDRFCVRLPIIDEKEKVDMSALSKNNFDNRWQLRHKYHAEHALSEYLKREDNVRRIIAQLLGSLNTYNPNDIKNYAVTLFLNSNWSPCNSSNCHDKQWNIEYHQNGEQVLCDLQTSREGTSFLATLKNILLQNEVYMFPKSNGFFPSMLIHTNYRDVYYNSASPDKEQIMPVDIKKWSRVKIFYTKDDSFYNNIASQITTTTPRKHSFFVNI